VTAVPAHRADATLDLAQELLAGVRAEAQRRGVAMGAAVVDAGGNLVAGARMVETYPALPLTEGHAG